MTDELERSRVRRVLSVVLKREGLSDAGWTREKVGEWDSLKHLEIVFGLEEELGIEFSEIEMGELTSLDAIVEVVRRKREA